MVACECPGGQRQRSSSSSVRSSRFRADPAQPRRQLTAASSAPMGRDSVGSTSPVSMRIHLEGRDTGSFSPRMMATRWARPPGCRQNRSVDVDGAATGTVEHGLGRNLAEGDPTTATSAQPRQPLRPPASRVAAAGQAPECPGHRALLDGRRLEVPAATGGLVGVGSPRRRSVALDGGLETAPRPRASRRTALSSQRANARERLSLGKRASGSSFDAVTRDLRGRSMRVRLQVIHLVLDDARHACPEASRSKGGRLVGRLDVIDLLRSTSAKMRGARDSFLVDDGAGCGS